MGSISINSGGDAVSATFTMDGDAMAVYGPGINIVSSPPPLTLTKASVTPRRLSPLARCKPLSSRCR